MVSVFFRLLERPLTAKQRSALERRVARLKATRGGVTHATAVGALLASDLKDLRLRPGFVVRSTDVEGRGASDRSLPPREERPPATRIQSSRGSALRLELIAIALQQARHKKAGARADNPLPVRPPRGSGDRNYGWIDLIASEPETYLEGHNHLTPDDKKVRQVESAVDRLASAGLVKTVAAGRKTYDGFQLLDERGGADRPGAAWRDYTIPPRGERCVELPATFITQGWVHVLEDSEIALLLMVACGVGSLPDEPDGLVAIPSSFRLLRYGIGRDSYSAAHRTLKLLGLLEVIEVGRHEDGKAIGVGTEEGEMHVHRLKIVDAGFDRPALATTLDLFKQELAR